MAVPGSKVGCRPFAGIQGTAPVLHNQGGKPLKKMQSLIVIACKILRIMRDGTKYDHGKMLSTGAGQGSGKEPVNDGAFGSRISNKTNGNQGRHSVHRAIDTADGEAGRYDLKNKSCSQR